MPSIAIVQARMGSTRLPGKALVDLAGRPVLAWVLERLAHARSLRGVVVATSERPGDDAIEALCRARGVACFRGSEDDVTSRFVGATRMARAQAVVRITADCPLVDPAVVDRVVEAAVKAQADYASNVHPRRTFPRGLDVELVTTECLDRIDRNDQDARSREHVTLFVRQHPDQFRVASVQNRQDLSAHRWTLDTPEDLEFLRALVARVKRPLEARMNEFLAVLRREPSLLALNRGVVQKAG